MKVSKDYVEDILVRTGLSESEKQRIRALDYPADRDELIRLFATMGVSRDVLVDQLGGSP